MKRPGSFSEIVGHDKLVSYFVNHIEKGNLPQFIILYGPEGTGKTSLADLIAINLVYGLQDSPNKANAISTVLEHKVSNDYIKKFEMSIEGGKDEAKNVIAEMSSNFTLGNKKVIICDESHNFSDAGQDVLLSQSEFIPKDVYLILLTTDLYRLKPALRSRAVPIHVPALSQSDMVRVLKAEVTKKQLNIQAETITLNMIAEWANNRPRTGLQVLSAFSDGDAISADDIRGLIGILSASDILPLVASLSGSMTFGLSFISEMRVADNIVPLVAEFIRLKNGEHSYKLKMSETRDIREALRDVSSEQLVVFLYGLTKDAQLTRRSIMNAYLSAHLNKKNLGTVDTSETLGIEKLQRANITPEFSETRRTTVPSIEELMAESDIVE